MVRLIILSMLLSGCTILNSAVGMVTGIGDCTFWHVVESGPVGLLMFPLSPLEGAYRGAQLGWYADRKLINHERDNLSLTGHMLPCSVNMMAKVWSGGSASPGITWDME